MKRLGFSAALVLLLCGFALGQGQFKVLYTFNGTDGQGPQFLVFGHAGDLYGTTEYGGTGASCGAGCGTVFELSPSNNGGWTETVLYSFCVAPQCADGAGPNAGLVMDAEGDLYGSTTSGGTFGGGAVFQLSPSSGGQWTESVLYNFCEAGQEACPDGGGPDGPLASDLEGNLYGTTFYGGSGCPIGGCGVAFELSPPSVRGGNWTESVLYSFCTASGNGCPDGDRPSGGLTFDKEGNIYGATQSGGTPASKKQCEYGCGTIFKLAYGFGGWTESVLFAPSHGKGAFPLGPVTLDPKGDVYGTFSRGGKNQDGAVFSLPENGETAEYYFDASVPDDYVNGGLILGSGLAYGTIYGDGGPDLPGSVFQITSAGKETVLYNFCSQTGCSDGLAPVALIRDKSGNLYGTTLFGGSSACTYPYGSCGVVFEITNPEVSFR
jgi:uncharacterized repeat protein (TIGR03803 family)